MSEAVVTIHFKDMRVHQDVKEEVERRCHDLSDEFPELTRMELTLVHTHSGYEASSHALGKHTEAAAHAAASESGPCATKALDKLRLKLRKTHDKRIFAHRRRAHRSHPRRSPSDTE